MSQYFNNQFRRKIWANRDAIGAADLKRLDEQVAKITEYVENTKFEAEDMSGYITKAQLKEKSDKNHSHPELSLFNHKHNYEELDDRPFIIDPADYVNMAKISEYYSSAETYDRLGVNTQIINCSNIIEYKFYSKKDIDIKVIKVFNDRYEKLPVVQLKLFATIDNTYTRKNVSDKVEAITYDMSDYLTKNEIYDRPTFNDKMNKKVIDAKKFISKEDLKGLEKGADVYTAIEFGEKEARKAVSTHTHDELVPIGEIEKLKDKKSHNHAASGVDFEDGRTLQQKFDDGSLSDGAPAQTRAINLFMDIFKNVASMRDGDLIQTFGFHKLGAGEGTYLIKTIESTDTFFDSLNGVEINEICDIKISSKFKARLMSSDGKISLWQLGIKDYNPNIESTRLVQSAINKCGLQKYNLDLTGCKFNARKIIINQGITIDGGGACYIINKWEEPTILIERVPYGKSFTLSNMVIGGTVVDVKSSTFTPGKGIGILVNMIEDLYRVRIEGVNVKDFSYAGMVIKGWDTDAHNNCVIQTMRCYFVNSYIGALCLGDVGSNAFEQSFFNMCRYGFINSGSVLGMDGCQFTHNVIVGFWNTNEFGTNTKVSRVLNCTSNHNDNCGFYSDSEAGIVVQGMQIWYGHVILKGNGAFSNFQYGGGTGTGPDGFQFFIDTEKKWTISGAIGMVGGAKIYLKNPGTLIAEANTRLPVQPYTDSMVTKILEPPVMLEYEQTKTPTFSPSKLEYKFNGSYQDDYAYTSFCKIGGTGDVEFDAQGGLICTNKDGHLLNRDVVIDPSKDKLEFEFELKLDRDIRSYNGVVLKEKESKQGVLGISTFPSEVEKIFETHLLLRNGDLYAWGYNGDGQLGLGFASGIVTRPTKVNTSMIDGKIVEYKHMYNKTSVKTDTGKIYVCGRNHDYELIEQPIDRNPVMEFTEVTNSIIGGQIRTIKDIYLSSVDCVFLTSDGEYYGRGANRYGELGIGGKSTQYVATRLSYNSLDGGVDKLWAQCDRITVLTKNGNLYGSGYNHVGSLGVNESGYSQKDTPTVIPKPTLLPGEVIMDVVCSHSPTTYMFTNMRIFATGYDPYGAFNNGTTQTWITYRETGYGDISQYDYIKFQVYHANVIKNKKVFGSGLNNNGQLGTGDREDKRNLTEMYVPDGTFYDNEYPVAIEGRRSEYAAILTNIGRVFVIGNNVDNQIGTGDASVSAYLEPTENTEVPQTKMHYLLMGQYIADTEKDMDALLGVKAKWKFTYTRATRRFEVRRNNVLVFNKVIPAFNRPTEHRVVNYLTNKDFVGALYSLNIDIESLL